MNDLKIGVIGLGRFGQFHCEKISGLEDGRLYGVYDTSDLLTIQTAKHFDCIPFGTPDSLLDLVDAVSVVSPTVTHFEYIKKALRRDVHVFVEKPITATCVEGREAVRLARERQLVLQVGHIERFNEALVGKQNVIVDPLCANAIRTCGDNRRCKDVCVIFDMMIHDIDIMLHHFGDWKEVDATGDEDKVVATVGFGDRREAVLMANRLGTMDTRRTIFHFMSEPPITVDYHQKSNDALKEELQDFVDAITQGRNPLVTGEDGLRAIELAEAIREEVINGRSL